MKLKLKILKAAAGRTPELLIYGDIGDCGSSSQVLARDIVQQLATIPDGPLLVRINSYGGRVDEGLAIYNALRNWRGTVTVRVEGVAASIAAIIALAGARIEMAQGSMLMIHSASRDASGTSRDMASAMQSLEKMDQLQATLIAARTGRDQAQELALLQSGGDRWFTAEEAERERYIDAIYQPDAKQAQAAEPVLAAALIHHLPGAGVYASALRARLSAAKSTPQKKHPHNPAARAATTESHMNWKTVAEALGITLTAEMDDAMILSLIAQKLGLAETAGEDEIVTALATQAAGNPSPSPAPAASAAPSPAPAAAATARHAQVQQLFAIARTGIPEARRAELTNLEARAQLETTRPVEEIRAQLLAHLADPATSIAGSSVASASVTVDARDKLRAAGVAWLLARAGHIKPGTKEHAALGGNPLKGMNFQDMARECLEASGFKVRGVNRQDLIKAAITHSTSDFPNIFENALNKTLLSGFELQKPSWNRFAKTSSLSDFRPHIRYRSGSLGDLEVRRENGEYKSLTMSDAERETITAVTRGGILNVSFEMLVNDDMSVFNSGAMMLGTAAARTLDKAVFALFALNGGNGPTLGDGKALFHVDHRNIAAVAAAPTVTSVEAMRVQMASQLDVSGNDFLDLRLDRALSPLSVGGQLRVVNNSTFDPDANNKLQRSNIVANLFSDIIDTPRLSGTAWYGLADPNVEPVIEVGFLDGVQTPQLETEEAFNQHGMKWRVVYPFGVSAIGYRGIVKNAGA